MSEYQSLSHSKWDCKYHLIFIPKRRRKAIYEKQSMEIFGKNWAKGKGQILNHSSQDLWVIETDSGKPIVPRLGPKRKLPSSVDADGFKRVDGKPILLHNGWWKVPDNFKADIFEVSDLLIPVSVMLPVPDKHFGNYTIADDAVWGEKLAYVTEILKNKRGRTVGYVIEGQEHVSVEKAIALTRAGSVDNVIVVEKSNGTIFLRTKKNVRIDDNLTA